MPVLLGSFLLSITGSIAARVMTALGLGFVSYLGYSAISSTVVSAVMSNYNSMAGATLAIVNLSGAGTALGIMLGGLTARGVLMAAKRLVPV